MAIGKKSHGAIYDMDDTMVDSHPLHVKAWEKILQPLGYCFDDIPFKISGRFSGKRVTDIAQEIADYFNLDADILQTEQQRYFFSIIEKELTAMPGLIQSLDFFKSNNFKIAMATSATTRYARYVLKKFNLASYFDAVVTGEDVTQGKPDPEIFILAAKKLKLPPEQCLVLEDATNGIHAANAAGCRSIAIASSSMLPQDLSTALLSLDSLAEINDAVIARVFT